MIGSVTVLDAIRYVLLQDAPVPRQEAGGFSEGTYLSTTSSVLWHRDPFLNLVSH